MNRTFGLVSKAEVTPDQALNYFMNELINKDDVNKF